MLETRLTPLTRRRDFRRLWLAQTVSKVGTSVSGLAIPLIAISLLHVSTFQVSLLTAIEMAAPLLVALPAGAWLDRVRCRPVLMACDIGSAVVLVSIPVAAALGWLSFGQLLGVVFLAAVLATLFELAYQSYLPRLVDRDLLLDGNGKLEASAMVAASGGPAIGGFLIHLLTAPFAILVDAASFLWSAGCLAAIRSREPRPAASERRALTREIGEGLRYVVRHPILRPIATGGSIWVFFSAAQVAVLLVFLVRSVGLTAATIGILFTLGTIGAVVGAVLAPRLAARFGTGRTLLVFTPLEGLAGLVIPLTEDGWKLGLFVVALAVGEGSIVVCSVVQLSYRQAACPERLLGRVNATMRFMLRGARPLGALLGGVLGTTLGLRPALWIAAVGMLSATLWFVFSPIRSSRDLPIDLEIAAR